MISGETEDNHVPSRDKQLRGISLESVLEKRRLDQALNAKEFAVCAGLSYSAARSLFNLPDFPVFHGHIFWQDFVRWRIEHRGSPASSAAEQMDAIPISLPDRASRILSEADPDTRTR